MNRYCLDSEYDVKGVGRIVDNNRKEILGYLAELKEMLRRSDYDRGIAYNMLWTAYFCLAFGEDEEARYIFGKYKSHNISEKNVRAPVVELFRQLESRLG